MIRFTAITSDIWPHGWDVQDSNGRRYRLSTFSHHIFEALEYARAMERAMNG